MAPTGQAGVWYKMAKEEVDDAGTTGERPPRAEYVAPSDWSSEDQNTIHSENQAMKNNDTFSAVPFIGGFSGTAGGEERLLKPISDAHSTGATGPFVGGGEEHLLTPISESHSAGAMGPFVGGLSGDELLVSPNDAFETRVEDAEGVVHGLEQASEEEDSTETPVCRNGCDPEEDAENSLGVLVELGCLCKGSMSRMCIKCLLNWFGPKLILERKRNCEVCQSPLNESVKKTVLGHMADHTGGRKILEDALGPLLDQAHQNARNGYARRTLVHFQEVDDSAEALPVPFDAPDADATLSTEARDFQVVAPHQQRRSFWARIRGFMGCVRAPRVLD